MAAASLAVHWGLGLSVPELPKQLGGGGLGPRISMHFRGMWPLKVHLSNSLWKLCWVVGAA